MEKQAGITWENGLSYNPSFTIRRKEGIVLPAKYMGIRRNMVKNFLPISFL